MGGLLKGKMSRTEFLSLKSDVETSVELGQLLHRQIENL